MKMFSITFVLMMAWVTQATAGVTLDAKYYRKPNASAFQTQTASDGIISPFQVFNADNPKFTANPNEKGWAVDHWRKSFDEFAFYASPYGEKLEGSDGQIDIVWTEAVNRKVYLAVCFRYLNYSLCYLVDGRQQGSSTYSYTNALSLADAPSKTGYSFNGWKTGGQTFAANQSVQGSSFKELDDVHVDGHEVTLTADWSVHLYTVAFDANGGTSGTMPSLACAYDVPFDLSSNQFARTGATFKNWNTKSDGTGTAYEDAKTGLKNLTAENGATVTLYAQWNVTGYTVTFDNQGADLKAGIASRQVSYGADPGKLNKDSEIPQKSGHDFEGYYEKPNGDGEQLWNKKGIFQDDSWPYDRNVTVYAKWNAHAYSIDYDGLDSTTGYPTAARYGEEIELPEPTKVGHAFDGWSVASGLASADAGWKQDQGNYTKIANTYTKYKADNANPVKTIWMRNLNTNDEATVTLKANWTAKSYEVALDTMGAINPTPSKVTVTYGETPDRIATIPDYNGVATFGGYFSEKGGTGVKYWDEHGTWVGPDGQGGAWQDTTGNLKLYAYKIELTYFIAYDGNGATNETAMATEAHTCGVLAELTPNAYGRGGYTFAGWATNATGAVVYQDQAKSNDGFGTPPGETNTLYAVWATNTYYVAFAPNGGLGEPMAILTNKYDQAFKLPACTYAYPDGLYQFAGWSNDVDKVVYSNLDESVSNLCTTAFGTNTLQAVWQLDLTPLSVAMNCDNLNWKSPKKTDPPYDDEWSAYELDGQSCARQVEKTDAIMSAYLVTNGVLRFSWKATSQADEIEVLLSTSWNATDGKLLKTFSNAGDDWSDSEEIPIPPLEENYRYVVIRHVKGTFGRIGTVYVRNMKWVSAGGGEPTPGEAVAPTAAGVADGVFSLTIPAESGTDYGVWTNADLTVDSWGLMGELQKGEGKPMEFKWTILGFPQLFFRAHKVEYR